MEIKRFTFWGLGALISLFPAPLTAQEKGEIPDSVRETPVVRAVRKVAASVVSINCTAQVTERDFFYGLHTREIPQGKGSGVIIDRDGLLITNYHVVQGLERNRTAKIDVTTFQPKKTFKAEIVTFDKSADLAVLRILNKGKTTFHPIARGTSADLMVGETVIAIGNPFGHDHTVTVGVLSARNRKITVSGRNQTLTFSNLLQTDAAINPGNSGGALVNLAGKLIGINNAIRRDSEGIGYAIPIDTIYRVLDSLLTLDKAGNFWLSMKVKKNRAGLQVTNVIPGGPAWRSGIRNGDRILAVGNRQAKTQKEFTVAFLATIENRQVPLRLERQNRTLQVTFKPGTPESKFLFDHLGIEAETRPISQSVLQQLYQSAQIHPQGNTSVRIRYIFPDGPAANTGIKADDILIAYTGQDSYGRPQEFHIPNVTHLLRTLYNRRIGSNYDFMIWRNRELYRGSIKIR